MNTLLLAGGGTFAELKGWRWLLGFVFDQVFGTNLGVEMVQDALKITDTDIGISNQLWDVFGVLALGLAIIGFLFELDRALLMSHGNVTMQTFFFPFVKFAACLAFISVGKELVSYALGLNNWLIDTAAGLLKDPSTGASLDPAVEAKICEGINDTSFIQAALFIVPTLLFCWIANIIPGVIMYYNAIVRKLEIILRVGFSPVAFADIYKGMDSTAVQWIKKFIALGLYGMGMILIMQIAFSMQATYIATAFSSSDPATFATKQLTGWILPLIQSIAILFAELGATSMIKQASNEVLGVR